MTSLHHKRRNKLTVALSILFSIAIPIVSNINAAPQGTPRKIVSDDFTNNRPQSTSTQSSKGLSGPSTSAGTSTPRKSPHTYRLASQPIKKPAPSTRPRPNRQPTLENIAQLGITIWKLRPTNIDDAGRRALIREKSGSSGWVPERVAADTMFREGDHVRLSIESPAPGFLYVIDRDLFSDETMGGAMVIFPWAGVDNQMSPGKLVDIPAQEDNPSYFTARRASPDQVGEVLTLIITSAPLDLPISDNPFQISSTQLAQWEKAWSGQSERFEMEGGAGEAWTLQEQQASAKKGTRQLTRDDPAPQTIYRVTTSDNKATLVNVRLRYAK